MIINNSLFVRVILKDKLGYFVKFEKSYFKNMREHNSALEYSR